MATNSGGTTFQITDQNVANAVVNEWQTLTWDLSGINPNGDLINISQMVVFVDWTEGSSDRAENSTIHLDNIRFNAKKLTDAPPVDTCSNGIQDNDETGIDCGGSCSACPTPSPPSSPTSMSSSSGRRMPQMPSSPSPCPPSPSDSHWSLHFLRCHRT